MGWGILRTMWNNWTYEVRCDTEISERRKRAVAEDKNYRSNPLYLAQSPTQRLRGKIRYIMNKDKGEDVNCNLPIHHKFGESTESYNARLWDLLKTFGPVFDICYCDPSKRPAILYNPLGATLCRICGAHIG